MVEIKAHGKLLFLWCGIADTVSQGRGGHLPNCHKVLNPRVPHQLFQVLMDMGAVAVESASVSLKIVLHHFRLGSHINHIKPKSLDPFPLPKPENLFQFFANLRIIPV